MRFKQNNKENDRRSLNKIVYMCVMRTVAAYSVKVMLRNMRKNSMKAKRNSFI